MIIRRQMFRKKFCLLFEETVTVKMTAEQNTNDFICEMCDYSTPNRSNLNHHTNIVHLKMKKIDCSQCSNKFGTNWHLKRHIQTVHKKMTRHNCDLCDYSSYRRFQLETHLKYVHLGIKDFKCDICDQAFSAKGALTTHVNYVHKKLERYKCDFCDYSSYHGSKLEIHSKAVHLGIKDFKCDICDKAFSRKSDFVCHVNKKYNCELCSFTLCTKRKLENHLNLMHAHQSDDLVKTNILIKEAQKDQMFVPETYSDHEYVDQVNNEEILKTTEIEIKEECVADPCAIDIDDKTANFDHKCFDEILIEPTKIEIKDECVEDPLAINLDNKETKVKQES
jgi:hypothetical protein